MHNGWKPSLAYNTFPLMNGAIVPPEIFLIEPWRKNFFWHRERIGLMRVKASWSAASNNGAVPKSCNRPTVARRAQMALDLTLDVRGMEPPEPLERVLETIGDFAPGDRLKLIIDCEPLPLYRILDNNGYAHRTEPGTVSQREITIWRK